MHNDVFDDVMHLNVLIKMQYNFGIDPCPPEYGLYDESNQHIRSTNLHRLQDALKHHH